MATYGRKLPDHTLRAVCLPPDILRACLAHAFSTEKEEIMGMLLGDWMQDAHGRECAYVTGTSLLTRSDKRKDRVEIAPEQLHLAVTAAERLERVTGNVTRVVGWYHSHPHITVFPSHVDLRTQYAQQAMDSRFFGLVVSCFNCSPDLSQQVLITCFQARHEEGSRLSDVRIPFMCPPRPFLTQAALETLISLPRRIHEEQQGQLSRSVSAAVGPPAESHSDGVLVDISDLQSTSASTATGAASEAAGDGAEPVGREVLCMHNGNLFCRGVVELVDKVIGPAVKEMDERHRRNLAKIEILKRERVELMNATS